MFQNLSKNVKFDMFMTLFYRQQKTKADRQEDFDDVDESEIDYEGEEKAHDRVNQIPNSQVNRNQQNKNNSEFKDMAPRSESQLNSINSYP